MITKCVFLLVALVLILNLFACAPAVAPTLEPTPAVTEEKDAVIEEEATTQPLPEPAAFEVLDLSVQPLEVKPKESVNITVSVANTGGTEGSYTVVLTINGVKEAENSVTIAGGNTESVTFSVTKEETASYSVAVSGLTASFTVVAPVKIVTPTPKPSAEEIAAQYNERGVALAEEGRYKEATSEFSWAIELYPDLAEAYGNRGNAYAELGQLEQAIKDYDEAIRLDLENADYIDRLAETYYSRGIAYHDQGKHENLSRAIADYTKAIDLDPEYTEAYYRRGVSYHDQGEYDSAIADYSKATELDPENVDYIEHLAEAYYSRGEAYYYYRGVPGSEGWYGKAYSEFRMVIKLSNDPNLVDRAKRRLVDIQGKLKQQGR